MSESPIDSKKTGTAPKKPLTADIHTNTATIFKGLLYILAGACGLLSMASEACHLLGVDTTTTLFLAIAIPLASAASLIVNGCDTFLHRNQDTFNQDPAKALPSDEDKEKLEKIQLPTHLNLLLVCAVMADVITFAGILGGVVSELCQLIWVELLPEVANICLLGAGIFIGIFAAIAEGRTHRQFLLFFQLNKEKAAADLLMTRAEPVKNPIFEGAPTTQTVIAREAANMGRDKAAACTTTLSR